MAGTLVVAVRSGLISALSDLPELADFEVSYIPRKGSTARRRCFTDSARFTHEPASLRATKTFRKEEGSFDLVLYAEGQGADADPVPLSESLQEAGAAVEDWVATHANWNNNALATGLDWLLITGGEGRMAELWADNGLSVSLIYPVQYRARLT